MIRIIPLLLSFLLFFSVTELHASAAEKWEYEPVMKDLNIHVKGYKVDQYGNAVNDYEYNTKIDPKTLENRKKAGSVGFGRLLKTTGWGLLGSAALEALLNSVDWILDPEAQSIWRYKKKPVDGTCQSEYCSLKLTITVNNSPNNPFYSIDTAEAEVERVTGRKRSEYQYVWTPRYASNGDLQQLRLSIRTATGGTLGEYAFAYPDPKPEPQEKEYLTPEQLADYANKTHPDYSNPQLAPKLEPKYSPNIASDLWKPSNPWEEVNSPTVQEVQRKLDQAQPEPKKDAEIKPNPETGGSVLPKFCDWAASICDFIDWVKQPPETPEPIEVPEKELEQKEIKKDLISANVRSCPADIHFDVQNLPFGIQVNKGVQMQPICDTIEPLKYVFQLFTLVLCGFILLRV